MFGIFEIAPNNIDNNDFRDLNGYYEKVLPAFKKAKVKEFIKQILSYIYLDKTAIAIYKHIFQKQ